MTEREPGGEPHCDCGEEINVLRTAVRRLERTVEELESRLRGTEDALEPLRREHAIERHRPLVERLRFERRFGKR